MPKVQPEYLEQRRQQIVDAAAACFTRSGFHQTTMQDICTEADLSPGAVYRYFRSKEEIIQTMCLRGHEEDAEIIHDLMNRGSTQEVMEELVHLYLEGAGNHELCALSIELLGETRRDPVVLESVREGMATTKTALADIIRRAQDRGDMSRDLNAEALSQVMMGLYQGLIWQKVIEPDMDVLPYAQMVKTLFGSLYLSEDNGAASNPAAMSSALKH
jgi:AcrR family transcriptional regulator